MPSDLEAELVYVISKFDKQIAVLREVGLADEQLEKRREQHYERLKELWCRNSTLEDDTYVEG
jgi:hypothetical protein